MLDAARSPTNVFSNTLFANGSNAEQNEDLIDFVSNGFKLRENDSPTNSSGVTYIYMAFAENPFKNSLAR